MTANRVHPSQRKAKTDRLKKESIISDLMAKTLSYSGINGLVEAEHRH